MNNILEVRGLCKDYGLQSGAKAKPDAFAVKDVSFVLPEGYVMGFAGPNGSGKTTVIKLILQVKQRDAGSVILFENDGAQLQNEHIGVVFDSTHFPGEWTLSQVEQGFSPFYTGWDKTRYADCLRQFDLDVKKKVNQLSRGMRVKLQIAIALSHHAKLLILDEPTSALLLIGFAIENFFDINLMTAFAVWNTAALSAVLILYQTVQLPVFFKFGHSKSILFTMFPFLLILIVTSALMAFARRDGMLDRFADFLARTGIVVIPLIILGLAAAVVVSFRFALAFYKGREF